MELTPVHLLKDSERLLRTHNVFAPWDGSDKETDPPDENEAIKVAFNFYCSGFLPIQVRWKLQQAFPHFSPRKLAAIQRRAEADLLAADSAPADLRRAQVAAARQTAIQGALAAGDWSAALRGLQRAGEIAGELREAASLTEEDLTLTVVVEEASPASPIAGSESVQLPAESRQPTESQPLGG